MLERDATCPEPVEGPVLEQSEGDQMLGSITVGDPPIP